MVVENGIPFNHYWRDYKASLSTWVHSGWVLTENLLDKKINRRIEGATRNHFLIDFMRCALNLTRSGANILHGKRPWYRASRDAAEIYFGNHAVADPSHLPSPIKK